VDKPDLSEQNLQMMRALLEFVQDYAIFALDPAGYVTSWNSGAQLINGYTANEILGKHFSVFYTDEDKRQGTPQRALNTASSEGRFVAEGWRLRNDGSRFWASVVITAERDLDGELIGFVKITRDLTERYLLEQATKENATLFQTLFEFAPDGIMMVEETGRIVRMNEQAEAMFGLTRDAVLGSKFEDLMLQHLREKHAAFLQSYLTQSELSRKSKRLESIGQRKDGSGFPIEITLRSIDVDGKAVTLMVIRDITELREHEDQEETRRKLREKETLLKEVHHRVKNNLQIVCSLLSIQAHAADAGSKEQFRAMEERVRAMALIHEKLYGAANLAQIDFGAYLEELITGLRHSFAIHSKGFDIQVSVNHLDVDMEFAIPTGLLANELVTNAIKHAYPQGSRGIIKVDFHVQSPGQCSLRVTDFGRGIPATVDLETPKTLGLQIINALVGQLSAVLKLHQEHGTSLEVIIPLPNKEATNAVPWNSYSGG
jgi:PAS domain S-box-containing protein